MKNVDTIEPLKSKEMVALSDDTSTLYLVSVDLGYKDPKGRRARHFVYGSQVYDTMFGIFATFDGKESDDAFTLEKISFELINFRGIINIGFAKEDEVIYGKVPKQFEKLANAEMKNNVFFFLQGLSLDRQKTLTLDKPIEVAKGQRFPLTLNRALYPLPETNGGEPDGKTIVAKGRTPNDRFFDSEFYYRNGVDYYDQVLRPGLFFPRKATTNGAKAEIEPGPLDMPSLRCHTGNVNLYY